jgi:hypothetical protein
MMDAFKSQFLAWDFANRCDGDVSVLVKGNPMSALGPGQQEWAVTYTMTELGYRAGVIVKRDREGG